MKEKILNLLKNSSGLCISEIAQKIGVSLPTASKFVHILEAEKKVRIERMGDMKIVRVRK